MPSIIRRRAPGIARAVALPAAGRTSGSRVPWMTTVGSSSFRSCGVRSPEDVIACSWRATPGGMEAAVVGVADELAEARLVHRVCGRADHLERLHRLLDVALAAARRLRHQRSEGAQPREPEAAVARRRHDRAQREHPLGVLDRRRLGDHPAHRGADEVGGLELEVVEQPDRVGRHVAQPVGRAATAEEHRPGRRHAARVDLARVADVAVVEADHPVAALAEQPAEGLVPVDHLRRQAHDQQHRLAGRARRTRRRRARSRWPRRSARRSRSRPSLRSRAGD